MLAELTFKFQNILDHKGFGVALTGLAIVFTSLAAITMAIAAMPKLLAALEGFLPPERDHHGRTGGKVIGRRGSRRSDRVRNAHSPELEGQTRLGSPPTRLHIHIVPLNLWHIKSSCG